MREFVRVLKSQSEYAHDLANGKAIRMEFEQAATFRSYMKECNPEIKFDFFTEGKWFVFKKIA